MSILPKGYKVPREPGKYLNFEQGSTKFRILAAPIMGYEGWTTVKSDDGSEKKQPVRHVTAEEFVDGEVMTDGRNRISHFWAMPVWNFEDKRVQVLEIKQKTIMAELQAYDSNEDWGDFTGYNITVLRTGEGKETKYKVMPSPKSDLDVNAQDAWAQVQAKGFDLTRLYTNDDPFNPNKKDTEHPVVEGEVNVDDIPF